MGADFYANDYLSESDWGGNSGGYYDGGGYDIGVGGDFNYGYGFDTPGTISSGGDAIAWSDIGAGGDFNYGYGFDAGLSPDYGPDLPDLPFYQGPSVEEVLTVSDLFGDPGPFSSVFERDYFGNYTVVPDLPDVSPLPTLPLSSPYDPWQSPPYIPVFTDLPAPQPPPLPHSPATQRPNLPPACPGGQYHPFPIGDPRQNQCVPFPVSSTPGTQQRPSGQQSPSGSGGSAPKPPSQQQQPRPTQPQQQQACPPNYTRNAAGQCVPIPAQSRCATPGTVFDQARGMCVPQGQAVSPLPEEAEDLLSNLKNIPWWVWLAVGGLFLLSKDEGDGRKTTVTYRRAR